MFCLVSAAPSNLVTSSLNAEVAGHRVDVHDVGPLLDFLYFNRSGGEERVAELGLGGVVVDRPGDHLVEFEVGIAIGPIFLDHDVPALVIQTPAVDELLDRREALVLP